MNPLKLHILTSHPIQYQTPIFQRLAKKGIQLEVGFLHHGAAVKGMLDKEFGTVIKWDNDLLEGYNHRFFIENSSTLSLREQISILPQMLRWVISNRGVPLLLYGWYPPILAIVWAVAILLRRPVMMIGESNLTEPEIKQQNKIRVIVQRWLLRYTTICFYIGQANRNYLRFMGVDDSKLIFAPYSVDNDHFRQNYLESLPKMAEICARYKINTELPVFLFVGKLIPKKRPLSIAARLSRRRFSGKSTVGVCG